MPDTDEVRKTQIKAIGSAIVNVVPPAARVALGWAEALYEQGVRIYPELVAGKNTPPPQPIEAWSPAAQAEAEARALKLLHEMAQKFPYLRPLLERFENAQTPEEKTKLARELREQINPEVLAAAQQQFNEMQVQGDAG